MEQLISGFFERTVRHGSLEVTYASGTRRSYGDDSGGTVAARFTDSRAEWAVGLDPALKFGEMYMDGRFVLDEGSLWDFVTLMKVNGYRRQVPGIYKLIGALPHLYRWAQNLTRAAVEKRHVAHHYDLDGRLFELFLDDDWQYTCALYEHPEATLEEAQLAKKRHVTAKLLAEPGHRVLEMGCGWGGLALYIAELTGAHVTGVTLSEEQVAIARRRAINRGLVGQADFRLENYRDVEGEFDRIISIGMIEHVGKGNYHILFRKAFELLKKDGIAVFHTIGRPKPAASQGPFNEKYIFPGGYIPAASEVIGEIERAGFLIKDHETLAMHYAYTLKHWRERFESNREKAMALYDERFCRMWEMYLVTSESAFRHDRLMIMQFQLAKHQDMVPYTRDYLASEKARLKKLEKTKMTKDVVTVEE